VSTAYALTLNLHNWVRWVLLGLGIWTLVRAYGGWLGRRAWTALDRRAGMLFTISVDVQSLLGLLLYFVFSPLTKIALGNPGLAMQNEQMRFFAFEHAPFMLLAWVLAHLAGVVARRAPDDPGRHRRSAIWFSLTLIVILFNIPWWRPLI
jgi:hypothetical protein